MGVNETQRPLRIPPNFAEYAEKHGIFDVFSRILQDIVIEEPKDPIEFIYEKLALIKPPSKLILLGPAGSGKTALSQELSSTSGLVHIEVLSMLKEVVNAAGKDGVEDTPYTFDARPFVEQGLLPPPNVTVELLRSRINQPDCLKQGWVLTGFPETRLQAMSLRQAGILPSHVVVLDLEKEISIVRVKDRLIDPLTGIIYHQDFDPPPEECMDRATLVDFSLEDVKKDIDTYENEIPGLIALFAKIVHRVNADQPIIDIRNQIKDFLKTRLRSNAPRRLRLILAGKTGSGNREMARMISKRYGIVYVSAAAVLRREVARGTDLGNRLAPFVESGSDVPEEDLTAALVETLDSEECRMKGWILEGAPWSRNQAVALANAGQTPSRVIVLNVPDDVALERITLRRVDPINGQMYHTIYNPPTNPKDKARLIAQEKDSEDIITAKLESYNCEANQVFSYYGDIVQHVDANQDLNSVFCQLEATLIKPLLLKDEDAV